MKEAVGTPAEELVLGAMAARYACKRFDPSRRVEAKRRRAILEAGRLAPSSFGLEHWAFIVADSQEDKDALYEHCFGQENLRTASFVVSVAVRTARHYAPDSDFVKRRAARFPGGLPAFLEEYVGYWEYLDAKGVVEEWARAQGYIACANMMTAAAALGVDSCPIEGYREESALAALGLDPSDWRLSLLVPFGYGTEAPREKIREPYASIVYGPGQARP